MKRELTLTYIAGYLPYGLKVLPCDGDSPTTVFEMKYHPIKGDQRVVCGINTELKLSEITPVLRPMSDLDKEITHKGETFIPIDCIAEMTREDGKDSNWTHDLINWFGEYDPTWNTCELLMALPEWLIIPVIDKLSEWMYDYRGLIDAGLAVSVHDLKQNPYEK